MNTNLQARLREVVRRCDVSNNEVEGISEDRAIAEIIQAFEDEGWLSPDKVEKTQKLVNQMVQTVQDMAKLPVTVREIGTMTGQEWYDRFAGELRTTADENGCGEIDYHSDEILSAAKRASGIEGEGK